jgi:hypothetical protein
LGGGFCVRLMVLLTELNQKPVIRSEELGPQSSLKEEYVVSEEGYKFFWSLNCEELNAMSTEEYFRQKKK